MAYAADMDGNFAQYFFCSPSVIAAPVVSQSTIVSPSQQYGPLSPKTVWLPEGDWVELPTGKVRAGGDTVTLTKYYDISETPVFVKAGAVLPSTTLKPGSSVGQASRAFGDIVFTVFDARATGGSCEVYEDDGNTTAYTTGVFATTKAVYTASAAGTLVLTVATTPPTGAGAGATLQATGVPATRAYALRLVNANPPSSVTVQGQALPFSRYAPHAAGTWYYEGDEATLVVNAPITRTDQGLTITVEGAMPTAAISAGLKGMMRHAILAKANLDETRKTPGAHTPFPGGSMIDQAASVAESLSFLAGNDHAAFASLVANFTNVYSGAVAEVGDMHKAALGVGVNRTLYSLTILKTGL